MPEDDDSWDGDLLIESDGELALEEARMWEDSENPDSIENPDGEGIREEIIGEDRHEKHQVDSRQKGSPRVRIPLWRSASLQWKI